MAGALNAEFSGGSQSQLRGRALVSGLGGGVGGQRGRGRSPEGWWAFPQARGGERGPSRPTADFPSPHQAQGALGPGWGGKSLFEAECVGEGGTLKRWDGGSWRGGGTHVGFDWT